MRRTIAAAVGLVLFSVAFFGGHVAGLTAQELADLGGIALAFGVLL